MIKPKSLKNKYVIGAFFVSVALVFIVILNLFIYKDSNNGAVIESATEKDWNTYVNEQYHFSIDFPSDWKIYEDFGDNGPVINIYKSKFGQKPPFDHFSEISNVSIFPTGIPTEGIIGQSQKSEMELNFSAEEKIDYILRGGDIWGTYVTFEKVPDSWKPWGFLWSKIDVKDLKYICERLGAEVSINECNPYGGDEFIREGQVDLEIREIQVKILESFKLIKS